MSNKFLAAMEKHLKKLKLTMVPHRPKLKLLLKLSSKKRLRRD